MAKVLLLNGSPHTKGCTARALEEVIKVLNEEGIETPLNETGLAIQLLLFSSSTMRGEAILEPAFSTSNLAFTGAGEGLPISDMFTISA